MDELNELGHSTLQWILSNVQSNTFWRMICLFRSFDTHMIWNSLSQIINWKFSFHFVVFSDSRTGSIFTWFILYVSYVHQSVCCMYHCFVQSIWTVEKLLIYSRPDRAVCCIFFRNHRPQLTRTSEQRQSHVFQTSWTFGQGWLDVVWTSRVHLVNRHLSVLPEQEIRWVFD